MAATKALTVVWTALATVVILCSAENPSQLFPQVEVTLANDGENVVWYMCQMTDKRESLTMLEANSTYRFDFTHVAFPMRWCYLYIDPNNHGFFWAYTVRNRCTKCFWSINHHPYLYRNDKGRWERQKLFTPPGLDIKTFIPS